jgi:hypothetical protein
MEVIAGEQAFETEVSQHGVRFRLDFSKVRHCTAGAVIFQLSDDVTLRPGCSQQVVCLQRSMCELATIQALEHAPKFDHKHRTAMPSHKPWRLVQDVHIKAPGTCHLLAVSLPTYRCTGTRG